MNIRQARGRVPHEAGVSEAARLDDSPQVQASLGEVGRIVI